MSSDADATRSQAPGVIESNITPGSIAPGETFIDEPEQYAVEHAIGAGGMGTVLAAKASRLGRSVALKIVTADREDLRRRFEREARVTARLQHPAIVPVYGSGRRAGQPFYAMKHVTGEPLDKAIATTKTLAERIALLPKVIAVTEAIAYAHKERVIHRDLKPANILVGDFGETVVIDWGLAKDLARHDDEAESVSPYRVSSDETGFGKVMGTPAYMPLEQARGEPVDERADVYALGAILYHVLAGAPPYRKRDEQNVPWETMLARVLATSPDPLELNAPGVPPDLIAIVARAMARDREKRYASALELAEDLRRFQTGQLVGAHRYSTWQLVKRWIKRNRTPLAVGAVAFVLLVALGVASVLGIVREQARTEQQRQAAVASRGQAEDLMAFMLVNLRDKLKTVGKLQLLDEVAKKAVAYYDRQNAGLSDADLSRRALAMRNLGDVLLLQGHTDSALREYKASLSIAEPLARRNPLAIADVSVSHESIGDVLAAQGNSAEALKAYQKALVIAKVMEIGVADASRRKNVAVMRGKVGNMLQAQGDLAGALESYRHALREAQQLAAAAPTNLDLQADTTVYLDKIGDTLLLAAPRSTQGRQDSDDALAAYRQDLAITNAVLAKDPTNAQWLRGSVVTHVKVGSALMPQNRVPEALAEFRSALSTAKLLVAQDPSNALWQSDLATSHENVAWALAVGGDLPGALAEQRESLVLVEALAAQDPTNADRVHGRFVEHAKLGGMLTLQKDWATAQTEYQAALSIGQALAAKDPASTDRQRDVSVCELNLGAIALARGDVPSALTHERAYLKIAEDLAAKNPDNDNQKEMLAGAHETLAEGLLANKDPAGAIAEYKALQAIIEALAKKDPTSVGWKRDLVEGHQKLGDALMAQDDPKSALPEFRAMLSITEPIAEQHPDDPEWIGTVPVAHGRVADALDALGDPSAMDEYKAALATSQVLVSKLPGNAAAMEFVTGFQERIKTCCRKKVAPRRRSR